MSDEAKVKAAHPGAEVWRGRHAKVWISDGNGNMLSDVCYRGTREKRRADAWKSAAERLGVASEQ